MIWRSLRRVAHLAVLALLCAVHGGAAQEPEHDTIRADWLVDEPADGAQGPHARDLAVIISGDGGWADLDRDLAARLEARGVAVLGVDALHYFWTRRTPDEVARELAPPIADRMARWKRDRLILIGFSFGAGILPDVAARLPGDLIDRSVLAVMLTSNTWANWEVHPGDWLLDEPHKESTDVVAPALALAHPPIVCVYGTDETDVSACPKLTGHATVIPLPGGHHFDGDYDRLADLVLAHVDATPTVAEAEAAAAK